MTEYYLIEDTETIDTTDSDASSVVSEQITHFRPSRRKWLDTRQKINYANQKRKYMNKLYRIQELYEEIINEAYEIDEVMTELNKLVTILMENEKRRSNIDDQII